MNIVKGLHGWEIWDNGKHLCTLETRRALLEWVRGMADEVGWFRIPGEDLLELLEDEGGAR